VNPSDQTTIHLVSTGQTRWCVRAHYFNMDFDLGRVQQVFPDATVLHSTPLIIEFQGDHVVVLPFGVILYWLGNEHAYLELMVRLETKLKAVPHSLGGQSELNVSAEHPEDIVLFKNVQLKQLSLEHIKVISETFGQSIALQRSQTLVQELLTECHPTVEELQSRGDVRLSSKAILKHVGKTLAIREATLAKLSLIDSPPEAWRSERLTRLHCQLYDHFHIKPRLASLQTKLDYLLDLNQTLMNLIQHHESRRLEWIIIILIVVEVIYSTIHFLVPSS
jgi:uncharacterized Rmd1/YagE family protein